MGFVLSARIIEAGDPGLAASYTYLAGANVALSATFAAAPSVPAVLTLPILTTLGGPVYWRLSTSGADGATSAKDRKAFAR